MDPPSSPLSMETELRRLQAELGQLQAGQAAEVAHLERTLAQAQAERAAAVAQAGQRVAEVAQLREEVARLRAELRRRWELCDHYRLEATSLRASARLRDGQHRDATGRVTRLHGSLAGPWALGEEQRVLPPRDTHCHRCPEEPGDTEGPLPVSPVSPDPEDAQFQCLEGTESQESTGGPRPFLLFLLASTIIILYRHLKQS